MKKIIIMAAALLLGLQGMNAQTENEENDDIITVTDKDGKSEEIEIPEGMEDNLDSLLHLYNTQTYLMPDTSCNYQDINPVFDKEVYVDRLIFEEALEAYNLPLELKYLPVIESALNPMAISRVGATGLWQFMLPTGKRYGLEVNTLVDERRDPVKASYAAAPSR